MMIIKKKLKYPTEKELELFWEKRKQNKEEWEAFVKSMKRLSEM